MGFFAPWFLVGVVAVGLPLSVHLLRKQTTVPRPFSSLMFFEQGRQSSVRHRRLRYVLLFSLRAALVLLLAFAFAQPFLHRSTAAQADKLLLVVIDDSFSMNAGRDGATRLDEAKREALAVLAHRRPSQTAQVMVLSGQLRILTQPMQDSAALRSAIEGVRPGYGHGTFGALGRAIRAISETDRGPIELHLFSDMQRGNFSGNFTDMELPETVQLVLHSVAGQEAAPNWTVESVEAPTQVTETKKARITAVVAGYATPAATQSVSLLVNKRAVATKKVGIPADGRATVVFDGLDIPYGDSRCAVRIESPDALPEDNEALFAVRRADARRVLFLHRANDDRSPLYFGTALASAAQASFVLQSITPEQAADVDPTKYAFVVLSDVASIPSRLVNAIVRDVQAGGGVLVAGGTSLSHKETIPVFGGEAEEASYYGRDGGSIALGQADGSSPVMAGAGGWRTAKFYFASRTNPVGARTLARLADGTPLLMDKQVGQGHVLFFASGFDNVTNDLPLSPQFVPFLDRIARYLTGNNELRGARVVDSSVELRSGAEASGAMPHSAGAVDVIDPEGKHALSLEEAARARSFQLQQAGFYQIRFSNGRDSLLAVNPDRRESDLRVIPGDVLQLWSRGGGETQAASQGSTAERARSNSPLWWWVMLLVTITALAESAMASGYLGTQREQL